MQKLIQVIHPGLLTTIQDLGRTGYQKIALSRGGAMDWQQMVLANQLVGNPDSDAGIEITGFGPTLHFPDETLIACTGAPFPVTIKIPKGTAIPLPTHRPVLVRANSIIQWHPARRGLRCWLAIAGGLRYPGILGSRSSHLAGRIGESALVKGATIPVGNPGQGILEKFREKILKAETPSSLPYSTCSWSLKPSVPESWPVILIPVLKGRHLCLLSRMQIRQLLDTCWHVHPQSNRQGIRLDGRPVRLASIPHLLSEPVRQGTIQLPPDGLPILMSCEHQTTGGYPRILEIPSCFTHLLAQASPDSQIQFQLTDLVKTDATAIKIHQAFERIRQSIFDKLQP